MYPLTRKNTSTPYMPRLNQYGRSAGMSQGSMCSATTAMAPIPRSASSQARRWAVASDPLIMDGDEITRANLPGSG